MIRALSLVMLGGAAVLATSAMIASPRARAWGEVTDLSALYWGSVTEPFARTPSRVIGSSAAACLLGAQQLPLEGPGYQAVRVSRNRHWGHPSLVSYLVGLGARAADARIGTVLVDDMAQPRGGPMAGHVSHQSGLDVDISFRLDMPPATREARESYEPVDFVDPQTRTLGARWTDAHAELIHLAATDARVSRIFVDAAVKRDLCSRSWDERSWLGRVRTWPRHADHLHVRLHCPPDSPQCREQEPLPLGEACGAVTQPPVTRVRRTPRTTVPPLCRALLRP